MGQKGGQSAGLTLLPQIRTGCGRKGSSDQVTRPPRLSSSRAYLPQEAAGRIRAEGWVLARRFLALEAEMKRPTDRIDPFVEKNEHRARLILLPSGCAFNYLNGSEVASVKIKSFSVCPGFLTCSR